MTNISEQKNRIFLVETNPFLIRDGTHFREHKLVPDSINIEFNVEPSSVPDFGTPFRKKAHPILFRV